MGLSLESMAIEMPAVHGHPNRAGFRGVLTVVDVASDRSPVRGAGASRVTNSTSSRGGHAVVDGNGIGLLARA